LEDKVPGKLFSGNPLLLKVGITRRNEGVEKKRKTLFHRVLFAVDIFPHLW
jgi:hypothetical protein